MNWRTDGSRSLLLVLAIALLLASEFQALPASWRKPLFFAHLGAFLLWQPVVAGSLRLGAREALLLGGAALLLAAFLNPWIQFAWVALVTALVGGRGLAFARRDERLLHLAVLAHLLALFFGLVLPDLLPETLRARAVSPAVRGWLEIILSAALPPLALAAWREAGREGERSWAGGLYDLVHSVWMLLLLLLIGFAGIVLMTLGEQGYFASIGITLVGVAVLLVAVEVLLGRMALPDQRGGAVFLLSRYLMSFAMPYERWLERIARLSREEAVAERFFEEAVHALGEFSPVAGASWEGAIAPGGFGTRSGAHCQEFDLPIPDEPRAVISVRLFTPRHLTGALAWHIKLLLQVAVQFYAAKKREERLRARHYLHAVHETGARLTHDVKNLLQSLDGLIGAAAALPGDREVRALVERSLPELSRRLSQTLVKLERPQADSTAVTPLLHWWSEFRAQHEHLGIGFDAAALAGDASIPAGVFSGVAENLIQNALQKRRAEPALAICMRVSGGGAHASLVVEDDGSAIDGATASRLFAGPVASRNGLGIGLYQAARLAESAGWALVLEENRDGCVRFALRHDDKTP
ncbi:MAG: HAMP domain-containing histidine kinase [Burkholderiales bacterium]|nr:HAMP domain-containing histidine kinase [Burkholderiales bacterium]